MVRKKHYAAGLLGILFLMLLILTVTVSADSGVYDYGSLFTAEETADLEKMAAEIAETYDMNILMLTTTDTDGKTSSAYIEDFYEKNGFYTNGIRGGIILLIDMQHRELNLETAGDMIYYITDEREEEIYDAGFDDVKNEEYGSSMKHMLEQTKEFLEDGIPDNQYTYDTETGKIVRHRSLSGGEIAAALVGALLCAGISCLVLYRSYSNLQKYNYSVHDHADIRLTGQRDQQIDKIITSRRKPKPSSSGGDSGSGRSSTHTSSGGGTYGGGNGRSF